MGIPSLEASITALKLRTYTAGNSVALNRASPQEDINCIKCHNLLETLGHILGQCVVNKKDRIRRHDEILEFIFNKMSTDKQNTLTKELTILGPKGTNLKPDLIAKCQERVFMVDVTVEDKLRRHDDNNVINVFV